MKVKRPDQSTGRWRDTQSEPKPPGRVHRLTADEVTGLVAGYEAGATVYALASQFGIHRTTVSKHLHENGVRMRRSGLVVAQVDQALELYENGWSAACIAHQLGVDASTVWHALTARGVAMRDSHGRER